MTKEQKAAVKACIDAFDIPRDCRDFTLRIYTNHEMTPYGSAPHIAAHLEVEHALASPAEV
jgi:hypothetical protein